MVSFEPVQEDARNFRQRLQLNGYDNVQLEEAAVSDHSGTENFAPNILSSMGMLSKSGELAARTGAIDKLVADGGLPHADAVKIDIEGGEHAALQGMCATLAARDPIIHLTTHGREIHEPCLESLRDMHCEVRSLDPRESFDQTDELVATFTTDQS